MSEQTAERSASTQKVGLHAAPPTQPRIHGRVAHKTRGRVRLQFKGHRGHVHLHQLRDRISQVKGVHSVEVHAETGSIVVHHDPNQPQFAETLARLISETGQFLVTGAEDPAAGSERLTAIERDATYLVEHSKTGQMILRYAEHVNRAIKTLTDGWVDLRVLFPASMAACAVAFVEVETAPLWLPLALFSFQSFNNLHQPHPLPPPGTGQASPAYSDWPESEQPPAGKAESRPKAVPARRTPGPAKRAKRKET